MNLDSHIAFSKFHKVLSEGAFGSILTFSKRKLRGYIKLNPSSASMGSCPFSLYPKLSMLADEGFKASTDFHEIQYKTLLSISVFAHKI